MIDFGALPPEVNSGRLYAGPGSGPIISAASAWQAVASQLDSVATGYVAILTGLQNESWAGNASVAMVEAAVPYVDWMAAAAASAEETAGRARAAAAAYEVAFAATVPPTLVAENRAHYAALVSANVFGQYTADIAAVEAAYAEMWAQDAQAMYAYAASSSTAADLTPFSAPPVTTATGGQLAQAEAVTRAAGGSGTTTAQSVLSQVLGLVPNQLQTLAAGGVSAAADPVLDPLLTAFSNFNTLAGPLNLGAALSRTVTSGGSFATGLYRTGVQAEDLPKIAEEEADGAKARAAESALRVPEATPKPMLAGFGQAEPIGGLSVPQTWASATPVASAVEDPQWLTDTELGAIPASSETTGVAGAPPVVGMTQQPGAWSRPTVSNILRVQAGRFTMPRPFMGG
ncbi:PPE family protein [Mycobacterium paraterrae]|uniref:PPE family protein n=1 Tax=Mycobacterium paraterrae TaxID=577492 RepID=A0ABY3VP91_9MYCO|nr:PPE family protein [Mycobacterium paraterrae]UMB71261.1 PPE family protein [Mycobacterium paraterrae]